MKTNEYFAAISGESSFIANTLGCLRTTFNDDAVLSFWERGRLFAVGWDNDWNCKRHWLNVISHMVLVAILTEKIALSIKPWPTSEYDETGITNLITAALIHDWDKRLKDTAMTEARMAGADPFLAADVCHRDSSMWVSAHLGERVAQWYETTGDEGVRRAMSGGGLALAPSILFYADCCVSSGKIVGYKRRFDDLIPLYAPGERYAGLNENMRKCYGMTHRETYDRIVLPIETRLSEMIGITPDELIRRITTEC